MNKELVKREVDETMARKGDKRKKVGKLNVPTEGVITGEVLAEEVEVPEQVNDNTLSDIPGKTREVTEELVTVRTDGYNRQLPFFKISNCNRTA
ncbi:hypothetical protein CASFOL_031388 [Castilleja foliolosa]|uniref:Uncharacterized protein n=1 Tax=Castilleja foliolosa TaxID=1961234 RepID=A0ABD3C4K3_9LAMI